MPAGADPAAVRPASAGTDPAAVRPAPAGTDPAAVRTAGAPDRAGTSQDGTPSTDRRARRVAASLLVGVGAFQTALACGAPWGAIAYGGSHPGTLPAGFRAASAASVVVYAALAAATATDTLGPTARRRMLGCASGLMVASTAMNLISPSRLEAVLWSPVAATLAVLLWRSRSPRHRPDGTSPATR